MDCSLCLNSNTPRLVPVCSFFAGFEYDKPLTDGIKKKAHVFRADSFHPVRLDIYLSGKDFDHYAYINSMYSFNMFFSLDYLIAKAGGPLRGLPIVQPITGFAMKGYYLWIRCSRSNHQGNPFIQFYNNAVYYEKFMNRRTAWVDETGRTHWSTMMDEENEITASLANEKLKGKS